MTINRHVQLEGTPKAQTSASDNIYTVAFIRTNLLYMLF